MVPRNLVISSSTLLATALLLTMLYSLARVLGASEADDTTDASALTNAPVSSQALAIAPTDSPTTESALQTAIPADNSAISAATADDQPVITSVSSLSTTPAASPTAAPLTAGSPQADTPQPSPEVASAATNTLTQAQPTSVPATPQPTTAPANQQSTQSIPAATATTQPRLTAASQGVETVRFVKEVNDSVFIIYRGQELWLVEHDDSCADLTVAVGGSVLIYSPGGFPASNARIVLPNRPRDCAITSAKPI